MQKAGLHQKGVIDPKFHSDQRDDTSTEDKRLDEHFLGNEEADLLKQLIKSSKQLESKIIHLKEEINEQKWQPVIKVEINDLHPYSHLLYAECTVEKVVEQVTPHILPKLDSIGQLGGESDAMTKHPDLLIETLYDESFFEKSKAPRSEPVEELVMIRIHPTYQFKTTKVGALLLDKQKAEFEKFLKENVDVFTWSHDEMLEIEPEMMVHHLNIDPDYKLIQQKRHVFTLERRKAI